MRVGAHTDARRLVRERADGFRDLQADLDPRDAAAIEAVLRQVGPSARHRNIKRIHELHRSKQRFVNQMLETVLAQADS